MQLCVATSRFESQLIAIRNREKAYLAKIKELELVLSVGKMRISKLKGELGTTHTKVDIKRCARIQTEELSNDQKLQIEFEVIEHYKEYSEYQDELEDYMARVYLICLDVVT